MRHRQGKVGVYLLFLIVGLLVGAMAGTEFVKWLYRQQNASSLNAPAADQTASGIQPIKPSTDQRAVSISRENAIVEATKMVSPSVVGIVVTQVQLVRHPYGSDEFFDFFFGPELMPRVKEVERMGSGFVFSKEGYILTNFHVVEGAQKLFVTFSDGRQLEGKIIGVDPQTDLAVISVKGLVSSARGSAIPTPCSSESGPSRSAIHSVFSSTTPIPPSRSA